MHRNGSRPGKTHFQFEPRSLGSFLFVLLSLDFIEPSSHTLLTYGR